MIRGIVKEVIEGFIKLFSATGRTDESFEQREYFQHYGFSSRPLEGAEIIIIREGNHIIAIGSDDRRYRLAIEEGEVALYSDEGDYICLKRDKTIHIVSGNKLIADITNEFKINCASVLLGNDAARVLVDERAIAAYNAHTHATVGAVPTQQMSNANHCTSVTKGA